MICININIQTKPRLIRRLKSRAPTAKTSRREVIAPGCTPPPQRQRDSFAIVNERKLLSGPPRVTAEAGRDRQRWGTARVGNEMVQIDSATGAHQRIRLI